MRTRQFLTSSLYSVMQLQVSWAEIFMEGAEARESSTPPSSPEVEEKQQPWEWGGVEWGVRGGGGGREGWPPCRAPDSPGRAVR